MDENLLPIDEIIKEARKLGATFGHGNPRTHLAYLTKLRLIPQTVRRKINHKITGCYPDHIISLVKKIEELKNSGLTYSQIRFQLQGDGQIEDSNGRIQVWKQGPEYKILHSPSLHFPSSIPESHIQNPVSGSNALAFLTIGLILGFLLALANKPLVSNSLSDLSSQSAPAISVADNSYSSALIKTAGSDSSNSDPIYLIAIPNQNLYRVGKIDINNLNRQ